MRILHKAKRILWPSLALALALCCQGGTASVAPVAISTETGHHQTIVASVAAPATLGGSIYYVDGANGSDSNLGTSRDQAWQTIQKAADTMEAGDYCIVLAGDYDERVQVSISGSSGAPITYWAEGTVTMKGFTVRADHITIRGFDITNTDNDWDDGVGVFVEGSHNIVEDNYIYFATRGGISVYADPPDAPAITDCEIRSNRLYRNAMAGIEVAGRNHLIESNEIWRTIQYHPNWENSPDWVDADGIRFFGTGHVIRGNYIHDIRMDDPENVDPHIDCFQTWGPAYDIVFEQNFCENLNEDMQGFIIEEHNPPVRNLIIRNDFIQSFRGINVIDCENMVIANNTIISDLSFAPQNQEGIGLTRSPNATIKNNIFFDIRSHYLTMDGSSQQGLDIGHNNIYRSDGQPPSGSPSPHDLWDVDPMFVEVADNDFHLQSASPCIDAGDDLGSQVSEDFEGDSRPQGTDFDIGADEYTASVLPSGEIIIDNTDDGFLSSFTQDAWHEYVEPGGEHYRDTHCYNGRPGSGEDVATWSFSVPRPGQYNVYAWWYAREERPTDVPFSLAHLGGSTVVTVNQQIDGGQWNRLGTFDFWGQGSVTVSDQVSSGQNIVADAVRIVYAGPLSTWQPLYLPFVIR